MSLPPPLNDGPAVDADERGVVVDLHAESLTAHAVSHPVRRVRVYRDVVTEEVMVPVTVRREVLRVEYDDLSPDDASLALAPGPSWERPATQPLEIFLREERPRVEFDVVAIERILLTTVVHTAQVEVSDTVRHEEVAMTGLPGGRHVRST